MILAYYGTGKGKTSAALGAVFRAMGAKQPSRAVFFMKHWQTSETSFLDHLKKTGLPVDYYLAGDDEFVHGGEATSISREEAQKQLKSGKVAVKDAQDAKLARSGLEKAREYLKEKPFLLILDEIGVAVHFHLIEEKDVISLIHEARDAHVHLILTGKELSEKIRTECDLVTNVQKVKHPFDSGIYAVKGLDY